MYVRAKKSLGQNFLRDSSFVNKIVGSLNLTDADTVFEIGPGQGALTSELVEDAGRVIAIEFDRDMVAILNERFRSHANFELIKADALSVDFAELFGGAGSDNRAKLVANLPYNISTPILQRLIDQRQLFSQIVLMFQREVVERITAPAGGKDRGFLSALVENAFETEYLFDVPPEAFQPVPKVWSGVVRLKPKPVDPTDYTLFRKVISTSFAQKRKTMLNNLKQTIENADHVLTESGIDPNRRAETLTLEEWWNLTRTISRAKAARAKNGD
ncbi:MAG TPA: 16S rRNA (adenine(1518)-N(6)/adenine(1519)-N(6))-dimethyltransferase RsmA [Pyrinomonadaceae bacterium]|nr:16S rRNA (adenine(1518)-N(6)/adenine(1519)-N(6))-dimethyltransferase RsmA [Pyrinomonadaceae bacterium]